MKSVRRGILPFTAGVSAFRKAKCRAFTHHKALHYNSLLRLRGVPDHITQMIIGHSNDRMTEHYTHVHHEEMAERFSDLSSSVTIEGPGDG